MTNYDRREALTWFRSLNPDIKIQVKDCFELLTGVQFQLVGMLLAYDQRICIMYQKLQDIGIEVDSVVWKRRYFVPDYHLPFTINN